MKFIEPSEISGKIMTLIEGSDEFVFMVSPYVKILKWYKFLNKLKKLDEREIPFKFIIRDDRNNENSFNELDELGYDYQAIKNLHCKIYLNEKYAIVTSMNLLLSSEINSIELAYRTETHEEYEKLKEFCERHLNVNFSDFEATSENQNMNWQSFLVDKLQSKGLTKSYVNFEDRKYIIYTGSNMYEAFIWKSKKNLLRVSGILTKQEYDLLKNNLHSISPIEGIKFDLTDGGEKHYCKLWATVDQPLKTKSLSKVVNQESEFISQKLSEYIIGFEEFKGNNSW